MDERHLIREQEQQRQKTGRYHLTRLLAVAGCRRLCMASLLTWYGTRARCLLCWHRPAHRQPVRPYGGAAAPPRCITNGDSGQRELQRWSFASPPHLLSARLPWTSMCWSAAGAGGRAQSARRSLAATAGYPLQPGCRGLRTWRRSVLVAGAGGALPQPYTAAARLWIASAVRAGCQRIEDTCAAGGILILTVRPRRACGRVRRPHGHRRRPGACWPAASCLWTPKGCPYRTRR